MSQRAPYEKRPNPAGYSQTPRTSDRYEYAEWRELERVLMYWAIRLPQPTGSFPRRRDGA